MQKVSVQSVKLEQSTNDEILQALSGVDPSVYEGLELFRGVALSSSINSHSLQFDSQAMRQVKDAFNEYLGVFTDHITRALNRVGKTLKSHLRDGNVYVDFGIQPGIEVSHSDDLIRIMSSLGSELSITFYPEDEGIKCGVCGMPQMPYWGGYIWMCENDHILGDTYKTPEGMERVIGIVEDINRVSELSVVGNGSDPNTEVVKQILEKSDVSVNLMATIAEMNNLDIKQLSHQLSLERIGSEPRRSKSLPGGSPNVPPSPSTGGRKSMSDPTKLLEMSHEDLITQVQAKSEECDTLKREMSEMKTVEEFENLATTTAELRQQIEQKDQRISELEEMKTIYDEEWEHRYSLACESKKKQMNYKDDDPKYVSYCEELRLANLKTLRLQAAASSAGYEAERLETPLMTINKGDGPRIGSGATN